MQGVELPGRRGRGRPQKDAVKEDMLRVVVTEDAGDRVRCR